jgi:Domain of unknown function (DUF4926)
MIDELEIVALTRPQPEHGLSAGEIGTVVMVFNSGEGYMVEFMNAEGDTTAIATVIAADVRLARADEIARHRKVA